MDFQSSTVAVRALQELVESSAVGIDHAENIDIVYNGGGWVEASVRVLARNLSIRPRMKRVRAGGEAKLRIESQQRDAATVAGVVRVAHAQVELVFASDKKCLAYYFDSCEIASGTDASGGCVHLVVPVPADATLGSEVVVRRVSVASCDVDLGEALVRFIVGFNNVPACTGRVYTAARDGDIAALVQALDDGCSTQEADGDGWTSLQWAASRGHVNIARLLLGAGASISSFSRDGWTPLHWAVYKGHIDIVRLLLGSGAPVSPVNKDGFTPLHWAAMYGLADVVNVLLEAGAPALPVNKNGKTPRDLAQESGHAAVVELLQ